MFFCGINLQKQEIFQKCPFLVKITPFLMKIAKKIVQKMPLVYTSAKASRMVKKDTFAEV